MEHIAPLIQTILWVGLLAVTLWRFHKPLYGLLEALQKRVEGGSSLKAGPFELTELRPQDPQSQRNKADSEELEEQQEVPAPAHLEADQDAPQRLVNTRARYFQAEDLVLRALQAEYGVAVSRQVTAGADMGFDGVFITSGRLNVVEVKLVRNMRSAASNIEKSVERIAGAIQRYGWRNAQIILAIVSESEDELSTVKDMSERFANNPIPVVVRCYSLSDLQKRFGIRQ
jgi:hypothetical protein